MAALSHFLTTQRNRPHARAFEKGAGPEFEGSTRLGCCRRRQPLQVSRLPAAILYWKNKPYLMPEAVMGACAALHQAPVYAGQGAGLKSLAQDVTWKCCALGLQWWPNWCLRRQHHVFKPYPLALGGFPPSVHRAVLRSQPGVGQAQPQGGELGFLDPWAVFLGRAGHAVDAAKAKLASAMAS